MRKFIIMGVPYHGNLGDSMITMAEEEILKKCFPECELNSIAEDNLDICCQKAKKYISNDTVIFLQGGGNIGDIYKNCEKGRRKVIEKFPNNKIIIFPQTCYFSNTESGKAELERTKQIYNAHNNLVIMAREEKTYEFMKENFKNAKIYLTPDIVMTLEKASNKKRQGVLTMLRNDKEKSINEEETVKIQKILQKRFNDIYSSDMSMGHLDIHNVGGKYKEKLLEDKLNEFQTSELVITDRLHGMILSAITETPCVAIGNFNYKVASSYKWLSHLPYVTFCSQLENIQQDIDKVVATKIRKYDSSFAKDKIIEILKREV